MEKMNTEPEVTEVLAIAHGLNQQEYLEIISLLGRTPTFTELGIFSVMWSEHCSYKNSIALLKTLPRSGGRLLVGAGEENAGLVDIGDGLAVAFKIESHNHPSAVEPYQGAATGVGGIQRDIFTMGARPIASLNSLRFGELTDPRTRHLFKHIVRGIADYGNSFGVPTVAGEVYFDPCYKGNPLVNAMSVGIVKHSNVASAAAKGIGNLVIIVGSATGKDGIHGATFASEELSEKSEAKRPSVQVGDPFTEKLLLEATLEAIRAGLVVGIQDMGAAGITCSTTEMSAKGKTGMEIDLDKVPVREKDMTAYEIMLSESQERMLLIAKPEDESAVKAIFDKWDLHSVVIGTVSDDGHVKVKHRGELKADVSAFDLVLGGGAPVYIRDSKRPAYLDTLQRFDFNDLNENLDYNGSVRTLLSSPNIASKAWVYEQYDHMVRTNTVVLPGSDAAVIQIKGTGKYLAMKTDCNSRYVYLNPRKGAEIAVAESARNVVCSGAEPLAITNCLNFGNPYKPEMYWMFKEAVAGIGNACKALNTPVTGGNVSFYNESPDTSVYPTPVIGMVGLIEDKKHITTSWFKSSGDLIVLLGENRGDLSGSEYLQTVHTLCAGNAPWFDLKFEKNLQGTLLKTIRSGYLKSAHDVSEGGIAVALIEKSLSGKDSLGCQVVLDAAGKTKEAIYFGEDQCRILITIAENDYGKVLAIAKEKNIPVKPIGRVTADPVIMINEDIKIGVEEARKIYTGAIPAFMEE